MPSSCAEPYHSLLHPSRESLQYEDEDEEDKEVAEGYSDEQGGV
jgi:hypothetical protein